MKRSASLLLGTSLFLAYSQLCLAINPSVVIETNKGDITVELYADKAPITVKNFLGYVDSGYYSGTIFHRVIPNFMIQGGGLTEQMKEKATLAPIKNEADNGLYNERGTLSMARTSDPDSATSQFFINIRNNLSLDKRGGNAGYAVFGKVTDGMYVVDDIAVQPTTTKGPFSDVPVEPILINEIYVKANEKPIPIEPIRPEKQPAKPVESSVDGPVPAKIKAKDDSAPSAPKKSTETAH
ncbi:peptidyl-prolyl cis-trans isomerase A (cyclophilin A)/peptidyl-prolyl cis-trans isomerase B (cyclophilin B) [Sinobacterium caligoides]|uniref:Peptidyl-prolyl cis-trans isomerase n=1 Tax=Sinobacterium caligoides TaxID=933926 RepID=A0A3N2DYA2_9GAMM|nr:peptidyl-prolyl cis-trans isomerase A (cyclophilin A)/peptidyl-prolyl cis-trans isomerase B (cyclophilin B) [Sinobacterium caligoides]